MQNQPSTKKTTLTRRSGQVVVEYVMILSLVVAALAVAKIRISPLGELDLSGQHADSKTIMERLSASFTVWMQDMYIIIALPS